MIRIAEERDIDAMLEIYRPYVENTTVSFEYAVPTRKEFLDRFRGITKQYPWLVWEEGGRILGYTYASRPFVRTAYSWCAEPSIYLMPEAQGRGIGRKLYAALEELLKQQGYRMLFSLITGENVGSVAFHEKVGYRFAGKLSNAGYKKGHWCEVFWLEKDLQFVENPMEFPTSWEMFSQDEQKIYNILYSLSLSEL